MAVKNGCNKVALGHHNEDVLETFFLSLFTRGVWAAFLLSPIFQEKTYMLSVLLSMWLEGDIKDTPTARELPVVYILSHGRKIETSGHERVYQQRTEE